MCVRSGFVIHMEIILKYAELYDTYHNFIYFQFNAISGFRNQILIIDLFMDEIKGMN